MKSTSYKSYAELVNSGELPKKQADVANLLRKNGPMTGRQISNMLPGAWKRLAELQDQGIVQVVKTTKDLTTGKIVSVWAFCGEAPFLPMAKVIQKKSKYRNDPIALSRLYDEAFSAGVKHAIDILTSIPKADK